MRLLYKIYVVVAVISCIVIALFMTTAIKQEDKIISESLDNNQLVLASSAATQIQIGYYEKLLPFELLNELSKDENFLFWHIINGNSKIVLSSKPLDEISEKENQTFKKNCGIKEKQNKDYLFDNSKIWIIPLEIKNYNEANNWCFYLGYSTEKLSSLFWHNFFIYLYLALALLVLILPITSLLITRSLMPIKQLAACTAEIEAGNYNIDLPQSNTKEIKQLIIAYRAMLSGLAEKNNKIEEQLMQINAAMHELEDLNKTLELKVDERTLKLNNSNSKLKTLTKKLSIEKEKAELANKSISSFMTNMSHEIRTPLNSIIGFSSILESRERDERKLKYLKYIATSGKTLLELINDILDLSRIEADRIKIDNQGFNLHEIIHEVYIMFAANAKSKNIDLQINYPDNTDVKIISDPFRIKQIIINLLGNALKFTEKGSVTIQVEFSKNTENNWSDISIDVIDTGQGIEKDQHQKIFNAFIQKEGQSVQKYGGTGLGLAISLKLANLLNGNLYIKRSVPGEGSIFSLELKEVKIDNSEYKIVEKSESDEIINFQKQIKILYVDDIKVNCHLFKGILEQISTNFKFIECNDGQAAIETVISEDIDIIFTDLKMPPPAGVEITEKLKKNTAKSSIPIIAITASTVKADHENFIKAGGEEIILKPLSFSDIKDAIRKYLPTKS